MVDSKTLLSVLFGASLVTANIVATKLAFFQLPFVGGVAVPAGFLAIGLAFLWSDLLGELHGPDAAHTAVNATIAALVLGYGIVYTAIWMPTAPFYEHADAFQTVMGGSATIVLASIITTLVSQHVDVSVFHAIRQRTGGRFKFARNLGSTAISQLVDTALFMVLGFAVLPLLFGQSAQPAGVLAQLVVGQYVVKLVVAGLDTPVFYAITGVVDDAA